MIGSSKVDLGRINNVGLCNLGKNLNTNLLNAKNNYSKVKGCNLVQRQRFLWPSRSAILSLRASASPQIQPVVSGKASKFAANRNVSPCFFVFLCSCAFYMLFYASFYNIVACL